MKFEFFEPFGPPRGVATGRVIQTDRCPSCGAWKAEASKCSCIKLLTPLAPSPSPLRYGIVEDEFIQYPIDKMYQGYEGMYQRPQGPVCDEDFGLWHDLGCGG